jgi:hypothetical protein
VTNVTSKHYWVTFIDNGLETIALDAEFDIIELVEKEVDTISFSEVEQSLISILRRWSDANQITPLQTSGRVEVWF